MAGAAAAATAAETATEATAATAAVTAVAAKISGDGGVETVPAVGTYAASGFLKQEQGVKFLRACGWEVRWEGDEGDMNNVCILRPGYDKDVPKPDGAGSTHLSMDQNAVGGSDWGVGFRSYNVDQANKQEGLDCTRGALDVVAEFFDECMLDVTKSEYGSCSDVNPITKRGEGSEWRDDGAAGGRSRRTRGGGSPPKRAKTAEDSSNLKPDGGKGKAKGDNGEGSGPPVPKKARH
uniref:Uncharacterized protein n=1 Tax=Florenciella parvula TaxID=236787 RepID=A0A7S2CWV3_9STRA|mmetsp:Transcript_617/g.1582  ORF Transcript_617/g.1582 Transcript_617/m.1582 type:complete len:236 (+) Transcript_617:1061-1768(+)